MRESGNVFMKHFLGMPFLGEDAVHFFAFFKDVGRDSFQSHAGTRVLCHQSYYAFR